MPDTIYDVLKEPGSAIRVEHHGQTYLAVMTSGKSLQSGIAADIAQNAAQVAILKAMFLPRTVEENGKVTSTLNANGHYLQPLGKRIADETNGSGQDIKRCDAIFGISMTEIEGNYSPELVEKMQIDKLPLYELRAHGEVVLRESGAPEFRTKPVIPTLKEQEKMREQQQKWQAAQQKLQEETTDIFKPLKADSYQLKPKVVDALPKERREELESLRTTFEKCQKLLVAAYDSKSPSGTKVDEPEFYNIYAESYNPSGNVVKLKELDNGVMQLTMTYKFEESGHVEEPKIVRNIKVVQRER